ncbi:RNA polymerase sigma-H factor SigH [Thermoclostridium stercorarium subsp. stercorarium DSM 8532]|uniref:RNA polymerase sigma factor SigS n=3 Tax=Thermoclostridium stercorarium TaxID=1510 RepID=L7VST5_THES1|nr:RNA polymerase sporulation sigma factor SigH [Thermoclostridium stercorarium]AGC69639.1 RNA polymerase sigma-H factor SigH [Thermoclostridium stercorarium subsp. stercorarium DSM 8532]AGI40591.1 RNA polymerase sigma factor [Thermoclostridium stercorarium subsp. stercorarium DSM 8532]ANW99863.1 RNA polymerase factor sigma-70 [Thermoclostridium stercorarium subsp. thermolacticum DSM 2910]ANX02487.1 RNA polymerase factor sigma-70 [Thermoclostridium stercorarium subsp. leptospartum DSM 9219]UZQ
MITKLTAEEYSKLEDEEIVLLGRRGDKNATEFLINKYKDLVKAKARTYFLIGADREDVVQEGMIGLFKATRDYRHDKSMAFKTFAELCITRQMITAIKNATRQKHIPLNTYISLNRKVYDDDSSDKTYIDMIAHQIVMDPEQLLITKEEISGIESKICEILSTFEWEVLSLYLNGKSYTEIANKLNKPVKSVDNALQRVKKKIEKYIFNSREMVD